MRTKTLLMIGLLTVMGVVVLLTASSPCFAGKLEEAIAQTPKGTGPGQINPDAPNGFMGIPGAPSHFWLWYILWGTWVGWIFSSVGAFGGIMAGVGHISVFGLSDYARTFNKTNLTLNKLLTDSIRTCNQYLVGLSALISSFSYYRMVDWYCLWASAWPSAESWPAIWCRFLPSVKWTSAFTLVFSASSFLP